MKDRQGQAMEYLNGAAVHMRFGRKAAAEAHVRNAWRIWAGGESVGNATEDSVRRFGVMARVAGVVPTPDSGVDFLLGAVEGTELE